MTFLKAEKEARIKENYEDKAERMKEREEDMGRILHMIKSGVEEEVKAAIKLFQDRLEEQENTVRDLTEQLSTIMTEIDAMKSAAGSHIDPPAVQQQYCWLGAVLCENRSQEEHDERVSDSSRLSKALNESKYICAAARRVVGLTPIELRMLDIQMQSYGAQNKQEAMLMEVKNYLKCVMKLLPSEIEKL